MQTFIYRAEFEPGDRRGTIVVSFPDVPEAITEGRGVAEARAQAQDALGLALLSYPARKLPLPKPRARGANLVPIAVEADIAAKLALLDAVRERGITQRAFARLISKDEREARRILDPMHATKLATLTEALQKLGQRLIIAVEPEQASARERELELT